MTKREVAYAVSCFLLGMADLEGKEASRYMLAYLESLNYLLDV